MSQGLQFDALKVVGVQIARVRKVAIAGRSLLTAIHKLPVSGPVCVMSLGLEGDEQADPTVHGGLDKAVYAYPSEHYAFWREARHGAGVAGIDSALEWGALGENLTLQGLLETEVWVGDVLRFPHCVLRVSQPREPCFKFNAVMGFNAASKAMAQSGFCGFYLSVDTPGTVQAGESFELLPGPRHVSIAQRFAVKMFKHMR
jgi:MOSC domain-containing protein YiiM